MKNIANSRAAFVLSLLLCAAVWALQLGDLTIEHRTDRVSIYGSLDLTRDKPGLDNARLLKAILDLTVAELEKADLPDRVTWIKLETVENPFV